MKTILALAVSGAMFAGACSTTADDGAVLETTGVAATEAPLTASAKAAPARPRFREVTIPAGTAFALTLTSAVASDTSDVADAVSAELTHAVVVDGHTVLPAGARVSGDVTTAEGAGRVKGRAQVAFHFDTLDTGGRQYAMSTEPYSRMAPATKGEDATKIGIGAGAGAVIGGLLGGKGGAAKGAAVGGGAGTGVVLATRGEEVRFAPGADVSTRLTAPLTVRVGVN